MARKDFWKSDWFVGVAVAIAVVISRPDPIRSLERKAHDIRTEPRLLAYFDQIYPSLSLQIVAHSLNLAVTDIRAKPGDGVSLGKLNIRSDPELQMYTYFYKDREGRPAFPAVSFSDVISGKIRLEKYGDKIVSIGTTAVSSS
jgi:serine/threonine-protein kinase